MVAFTTTLGSEMELLRPMADELPDELGDLNPGSAITPENIRRRREEMGLTQLSLGDLVGVSDRAVRAWESGKSKPEGKVRARLAKVLSLTYTPARRRAYVKPSEWPELELVRRRVRELSNDLRDASRELRVLSDMMDNAIESDDDVIAPGDEPPAPQ